MPKQKQPMVLIGGGGHSRVVAEIARLNGYAIQGYVAPSETRNNGLTWLGGDTELNSLIEPGKYTFAIALGDQKKRIQIFNTLLQKSILPPILVHPTAILSQEITMQAGTVVCAAAVVNVGCVIGYNCLINTGAQLDHDCHLADQVQIGPGTVFCGGVSCGAYSSIGAGVTVIPARHIGRYVQIGAGSLVLHDIPDNVVAHGRPCQVKKMQASEISLVDS